MSSGPVAVGHLQLALQWQYELLRSGRVNHSSAGGATNGATKGVQHVGKCESGTEEARLLVTSATAVSAAAAEDKPPSLSSFDSGFDGAASSQPEAWGGREGAVSQPEIHKGITASVSDCEDGGSVGSSSGASVQIVPKVTVDSLNLEIKVKRSAALPNNPWLSLPVEDLENSYTVTITQNRTPQKRELPSYNPPDPRTSADQSDGSRDQPTQTEALSGPRPRGTQSGHWTMCSQSGVEDPELSPVRHLLSSTITDGRDKSICTTEGIPTLLWDSYDLHHQNDDAVDG